MTPGATVPQMVCAGLTQIPAHGGNGLDFAMMCLRLRHILQLNVRGANCKSRGIADGRALDRARGRLNVFHVCIRRF